MTRLVLLRAPGTSWDGKLCRVASVDGTLERRAPESGRHYVFEATGEEVEVEEFTKLRSGELRGIKREATVYARTGSRYTIPTRSQAVAGRSPALGLGAIA